LGVKDFEVGYTPFPEGALAWEIIETFDDIVLVRVTLYQNALPVSTQEMLIKKEDIEYIGGILGEGIKEKRLIN